MKALPSKAFTGSGTGRGIVELFRGQFIENQ